MGLIWRRRSASVKDVWFKLNLQFLLWIFLVFVVCSGIGVTIPGDVAAINNLYVSFGSPVLPGWVASGGDPCGEAWQGVQCNNSNILSIILNGANLGGELGNNLDTFASIIAIDLSNNHIGGSIPSSLPTTMKNFFLSANQFTGSIPTSLSSLTQLSAMSLNNNLLSGDLPDAFQSLTGLINLDLSNNNLSGYLPPSMGNLASLTTLHVQDNQLSGTLDILEKLPLRDLNIENNLFSGPIPQNLLSIPNFKKDGNPFNSSVAPLPSLTPSTPSPPQSPFLGGGGSSSDDTPSGRTPVTQAARSSTPTVESKSSNKSSTKRIVWVVIAVVVSAVISALVLALIIPVCLRRRKNENNRITKRPDAVVYDGRRENARENSTLVLSPSPTEKVPREMVVKVPEENPKETRRVWAVPRPQNDSPRNFQIVDSLSKKEDLETDMSDIEMYMLPPPPPPAPPAEFTAVPAMPVKKSPIPSPKNAIPPISAKSFTVAALQQYTNSFSQENLIGSGMLGSVYRAELPNGRFLAVKKLDKQASDQQKDDDFLHLVNDINKIRHANVVELTGYCAEHGQRLLIFEYRCNGTLQDALHGDDESKKKLSWNCRIRMALGAARALEYLHEVCQPPIVLRNFKSTNLLLDDDLTIHVSDCGLAPLISSGSVSQLSEHLLTAYGYGAPEFESGIYTIQSDVYSFGVVMLELLTGRKSYDRTRARGEQFLVRWAIPQLHDIDALSTMVDPSLKGQYPNKSLSRFADIISKCVQTEREFRPPMSEVVQDLLDMISYGEEIQSVHAKLPAFSLGHPQDESICAITRKLVSSVGSPATKTYGFKCEVPLPLALYQTAREKIRMCNSGS